MRTHLLLASLGLLAKASETPRPKSFDCGTDTAHASEDFLKTIQALHSKPKAESPAARAALAARDKAVASAPTGPITIDAIFHIVAKTSSRDPITNDIPAAQLDTLNESYKTYNTHFNLINVTWDTNDAWAVGEKDDDTAMKKALRQGTYNTLNLYFQTDLSGGVLGRCTLPSTIANGISDPTAYFNDGCNVNAHTMPAGAMVGYNAGKTAVHETGHWLGLLHTFEGYSCNGPGDYIHYTPVEAMTTNGRPSDFPKKSCPGKWKEGEMDPIHSYMDYSVDACYEGFSDLQVVRMRSMWGLYRNRNYGVGSDGVGEGGRFWGTALWFVVLIFVVFMFATLLD